MVWVYIIGGVPVLVVGFCVWNARYTRRCIGRKIKNLTAEDIERLAAECIAVFREKFGVRISLDDWEGSASALDLHIKQAQKAFSRKDFVSYFVLPVGAFWGELIVAHMDAEWQREAYGGLSIGFREQDAESVDPFAMVYQRAYGRGTTFRDFFRDVEDTEPVNAEHRQEVDVPEGAASESNNAADSADTPVGALQKQHERGANWFYWIAGLSVVNSLVALSGAEGSFVIGLGITQVIDALVLEFGEDAGLKAKLIAFAFDLMIAAFVVLFGYLARKRLRWAYVVGMMLYGLDGLLFLLAQDFLSLAFHAIALWGIYAGFRACRQLCRPAAKPEPEGTVFERKHFAVGENGQQGGQTRAVVWPTVVSIMTFVYVVFYGVLAVRSLSQYCRIAGCLFLLGGIAGIVLKRKAAVKVLLGGALLIVAHTLYLLVSAVAALPKQAPPATVVTVVVILFIPMLWPLFLIFWFMRKPVREHVAGEWV